MAQCETCGTKLPTHKAGRPRKFCGKECRVLNDAIVRLEKALDPVTTRLVEGDHRDHLNLVELRYRLFTLVSEQLPRPRYPKGHAKAGQFMKRAYT